MSRPGRGRRLVAACILTVLGVACGKKGPPLPPLVRVPDAVQQAATRRMGSDVFLSFTLPVRNVDESTPVALGRVDVYGYTGSTAPPLPRFAEVGTLVGSISAVDTPSNTLRDELTPDELVQGRQLAPVQTGSAALPTQAPRVAGPLKRFYMVVPFSDRGRAGPPVALEVPLVAAPDPPSEVIATYTAQAATVTWDPSGGIVGFLLDLSPPPTASPLDDVAVAGVEGLPAGPTRYNVYREIEPDPAQKVDAAAKSPPAVAPPLPLNTKPIEGFSFDDPLQVDGRRRCYTVTAVRGMAALAVEGARSNPVCLVPVDTFPPAAPTGVSPIAVEGAISLVWEANTEPDVAGYLILRGGPGDEKLVPVTEQPVAETRFTDSSVVAGERYVYAVVAVDKRSPEPNVSAESERIEITAR